MERATGVIPGLSISDLTSLLQDMPAASPTALIVIDLLNDYFDAELWPRSVIPGCREVLVENTNTLVSWCREQEFPVIWVRQAFAADLKDAFPHMRRSGRAYTIAGTPGAELLPELGVEAADRQVVKRRFSAFFDTTLHATLQEWGCRRVILAGITTAWCIRSTATDAYQHDYEVLLADDCMMGFTEADHQESLAAMDGFIARRISRADLTAQL
jgi:nicotinamidase-related amidase